MKKLIFISLLIILVSPFIGVVDAAIDSPIIWYIRVPRILTAFMVGGALSLCGMVFQNLFRSVLATPFTLGTSSGAAFGAALAISLGLTSISIFPLITILAFTGALVAATIVHLTAHYKRNCTMSDMLLAGVAVNFFFASLLLLVQYIGNPETSFEIIHWLFGRLTSATYVQLLWLSPIILFFWFLMRKSAQLDQLTIGEELALARGLNVAYLRKQLFIVISLVVALVVSNCGPIGFVGMMAPHICRNLTGLKHRNLIPASFLFGGSFLVFCDTLARTIAPPLELPVGIITALCGGPFFIFILIRKKN